MMAINVDCDECGQEFSIEVPEYDSMLNEGGIVACSEACLIDAEEKTYCEEVSEAELKAERWIAENVDEVGNMFYRGDQP